MVCTIAMITVLSTGVLALCVATYILVVDANRTSKEMFESRIQNMRYWSWLAGEER